jgi:hypothetical protein
MMCVMQGQLELVVKEVDVLEGKQADLQVPSQSLRILTILLLTIIYPHNHDPHNHLSSLLTFRSSSTCAPRAIVPLHFSPLSPPHAPPLSLLLCQNELSELEEYLSSLSSTIDHPPPPQSALAPYQTTGALIPQRTPARHYMDDNQARLDTKSLSK